MATIASASRNLPHQQMDESRPTPSVVVSSPKAIPTRRIVETSVLLAPLAEIFPPAYHWRIVWRRAATDHTAAMATHHSSTVAFATVLDMVPHPGEHISRLSSLLIQHK